MKKTKYCRIGERKRLFNGSAFIDGATDNGFCYKDYECIKRLKKGICYIAECAFNENNKNYKDNALYLDIDNIDEYIANGSVTTYASARREVEDYLKSNDILKGNWYAKEYKYNLLKELIDYIVDVVFDIIDWQCFNTCLNEIDIEELYEHFCNVKLIERINGIRTTYLSDAEIDDLKQLDLMNVNKWEEYIKLFA